MSTATAVRHGRVIVAGGLLLLAVAVSIAVWLIVDVLLPGHHDFAGSRSAAAGATTLLRIDADGGMVELRPSPDDRVHVSATGQYTTYRPTLSLHVSGPTMALDAHCPNGPQRSCTVGLWVSLPATLPVRLTSTDSDVAARGLSGPLSVDSVNGMIEVADPTGVLTLTGSNGDVTVTGAASSRVRVRSTNGSIRVVFTHRPRAVDLASANGSVTVVVPPGRPYAVNASSQTGGTSIAPGLTGPGGTDTITAHSVNGAVRVDSGAG